MPEPLKVTLVSLEPWDGVWRRNQHLAAQLVRQGIATRIRFVEPLVRHPSSAQASPPPGIEVVRLRLAIPKRAGGYRIAARSVRGAAHDDDIVWVNDPAFGRHCVPPGTPAVYDVTDDWRAAGLPDRVRRRLVRAEDRLARRATTVVCSEVLRRRWNERYAVDPEVVHNGVDEDAWRHVRRVRLPGPGPHVGYVGTLHEDRLDVDVVLDLAREPRIGTVHLVGPDVLSPDARQRLQTAGVVLHGPVPAVDVPSWTCAMDVLICPHRVTDFTLSLDAIKAREYRASGRPTVATPSSGFQFLGDSRTSVVSATEFTAEVVRMSAMPRIDPGPAPGDSWGDRAAQFGRLLCLAAASGRH